MICYFFIDFNDSGQYYHVGIECNCREEAETYFQMYSKDVRFQKIAKARKKRETGCRVTPVGIIVCCEWTEDKCSTLSTRRRINALPDTRQEVCGGYTIEAD